MQTVSYFTIRGWSRDASASQACVARAWWFSHRTAPATAMHSAARTAHVRQRRRLGDSVVFPVESFPGGIDRFFHLFPIERRPVVAVEPLHWNSEPPATDVQTERRIFRKLLFRPKPGNESRGLQVNR